MHEIKNGAVDEDILVSRITSLEVTKGTDVVIPEDLNEEDGEINEPGEANSKTNDAVKKKHRRRQKKQKQLAPDVSSDRIAIVENQAIESAKLMPLRDPRVRHNSDSKAPKALPEEISNWTIERLLEQPFGSRCIQKKGKVVHISESSSRLAGGRLKLMNDKNPNWGMFHPSDSRVPRMMIPMDQCPHDFYLHSEHYKNSLFMASIHSWSEFSTFPSGKIKQHLGNIGDIDAETSMILLENQVDDFDFPDEAYNGLPELDSTGSWHIPAEELKSRRDFRNEYVFTIDPATARDLDDALSIRQLDIEMNGKRLFEVGVHIADVSYFLNEGMPLDDIARHRTTSVYLVQRVIPMLPRLLCEKLCSLTPGKVYLFSLF